MVCWFCAARSAAALGGALLDIAPVVRSIEFNGKCEPGVSRALITSIPTSEVALDELDHSTESVGLRLDAKTIGS